MKHGDDVGVATRRALVAALAAAALVGCAARASQREPVLGPRPRGRFEYAAEAREGVGQIQHVLDLYVFRARRGLQGGDAANPLPASAPRTPATIPRGAAVTDPPGTWSHPTWATLGFAIDTPHRYSFEVETRERFVSVRAYGDLDGDGTYSTFERRGSLEDGRSAPTWDETLYVTNELE